jgi:hypothetical protein
MNLHYEAITGQVKKIYVMTYLERTKTIMWNKLEL